MSTLLALPGTEQHLYMSVLHQSRRASSTAVSGRRSAIRVRTAVVYHAKSVLRNGSPSSVTPELRSRRILCRLLVQQYLVRKSTRYQYIFISGVHKSRRVSSTEVHQQPCRVRDRQYEYVTVVYLSCDEGVVLLLFMQCSTGTRRIILLILNEM